MPQVWEKTILETKSTKLTTFFFGSVGSFFAPFVISKTAFGLDITKSIIIGVIAIPAVFVMVFLINLIKHTIKHIKYVRNESPYGEAIVLLNDAFAKLHLIRKLDKVGEEQTMAALIFTCNQLKIIFDSLTKTHCSISIKVSTASQITADTTVLNLCRDKDSISRDTEAYKKVAHFVFGNTCFNMILNHISKKKKAKLFYMNNDIPDTKDYQNTSKELYRDEKLPYNSEIVVPILPIENDNDKVFSLIGFICVDSVQKNAFEEKYHLAILRGVADGIYDIIYSLNYPPQK